MGLTYPKQRFGRFELGLGFNLSFLHRKWGFDLGERFHKDPARRIATTMEIDRAVHEAYGDLGVGFAEPFPCPAVEPFGHRFVPAMYGCPCRFDPDGEPWAEHRSCTKQEILRWPDWDRRRFEQAEPVRETVEQARFLQRQYGYFRDRPDSYSRHFHHGFYDRTRPFTCMPNLGSVVNSGTSLLGQELYINYLEAPDVVAKLYDNITQLMILCIEYFQEIDGRPLRDYFIGNCTVAMISPAQYMTHNCEHDQRFISCCTGRGMEFIMHQDSDATAHLANYAKLPGVGSFDLGQDTDFEQLAELAPRAAVNCILFPHEIMSHSLDDVGEMLGQLMHAGKHFPYFSFTLGEIDIGISDDRLFGFYEVFRRTADRISASKLPGC